MSHRMSPRVLAIGLVITLGALGLATPARATEASAGGTSRAAVYRQVAALAAIGRRMFADPALSPAKLACASCHSPNHAFGPPNALPVQLGGDDLRQPGLRAVPSLRYLQAAPPFTEHFFDSDDAGDESVDNGPTGGLTWDGRVDGGSAQARIPLLSPFEMGNPDPAAVVERVERAGYGAELRRALGMAVLADTAAMFKATLKAFEVFEQDGATFYPYSSKYDAYLDGRARLTAQELRGLELFEAPGKGNCASCHPSGRAGDGTPPQFTDYGLIALGVARNPAIPANADPGYTIWACAARCAAISVTGRIIAASSRRRPCATSPPAGPSSTTASSTACAVRSPFMSSATRGPSAGTRATRTAACASSTTCLLPTGPMSTPTRPSGRGPAPRRPSPRARSTTWWPSSAP